MKVRQVVLRLASIYLLSLMFVFPGAPVSMSAEPPKEVLVGNLHPLTGPIAPIGTHISRAIKLAVEEINASGGIKSLGGAKIKLIDADTEGKPDLAMQECEKLIREGVTAIIGAYQSAATFTSTAVAEKYKVPYIVPVSVADEITERGFKYVFRNNGKSDWISRDTIDYITYLNKLTGRKSNKLALIYEDTIYGQSTAKAARKYAADAKIDIVADLPYPANAPDLTQVVMKLKQAKPNFVMGAGYVQDAILILNTVKDLRVDLDAFIGIGAGYSNPQILQIGKAAEYMICLDVLHGDLKIKGLKEADDRFLKKYNSQMDGSCASSYAAVYILKDALERAGFTDREKLRNALAATNLGIGEHGNIISAPIKYDKNGQIDFHFMFKQVINGKYVSVYPPDLAPKAAIFPVPKWKDR